MNPNQQLAAAGQSLWLDYIRRSFLVEGGLAALVREDGLTGVTSNPAIFDEAVAAGDDYDESILESATRGESADEAYRRLAVTDVQMAADDLREVHDLTDGRDGYASLEVSPHLAHDTDGSVAEARELWEALDRPNVFIKIPGTQAGLPAIARLIAEGINVNVTLLFGLARYQAVVDAWLGGLEQRRAAGRPVDRVACVASFFLSRIDLLVDRRLDELIAAGGERALRCRDLKGRTAIACAKLAYEVYQDMAAGERFRRLAEAGARPQRLLWASTSTKNPAERDTRYVEALIGPDTINTMPLKTLEAFRDHGDPTPRLTDDVDEARLVLANLAQAAGIDLDLVAEQLEREGVGKFKKPFDNLLGSIAGKLDRAVPPPR